MTLAPPPHGSPRAYGGCTCSCHRGSGIRHVAPCCRPGSLQDAPFVPGSASAATFQCPHCAKKFLGAGSLQDHVRDTHQVDSLAECYCGGINGGHMASCPENARIGHIDGEHGQYVGPFVRCGCGCTELELKGKFWCCKKCGISYGEHAGPAPDRPLPLATIIEDGTVAVPDGGALAALFDKLPEVPHGGVKSIDVVDFDSVEAIRVEAAEALYGAGNALPIHDLAGCVSALIALLRVKSQDVNLLGVIADIREASGVGSAPMLSELAAAIRDRAAVPITDARVKAAAIEFLSHRGEHPQRITRRGAELWEDYAPAIRAALEMALKQVR